MHKPDRRNQILGRLKPFRGSTAILFAGFTIVAGISVLVAALASGDFGFAQVSGGILTGIAQVVTDSGASNGKAVSFGSGVATPTPTASPSPSPTPPAPYTTMIWSDEFNGALGAIPDPTKWNFETGAGGWGNSELECYTNSAANAQTNGQGQLVISALATPGHVCSDGKTANYTSARLDTLNHESFTYGRMEMSAKVPTAAGMWPAFWALGNPPATWPTNGEIDTMESIGSFPAMDHGTIHGPKYTSGGVYSGSYGLGGTYSIPSGTLSDAYHTYGVDWTSSQIAFDFDGQTYYTVTKAQVDAFNNPTYTWEFDHPFYMILNLAVGGTWPGPPTNATAFPQNLLVDYVRVYQ